MPQINVLIEVDATQEDAFEAFAAAVASEEESARQREELLGPIAGLEGEPVGDTVPVPMFIPPSSPDGAPPELEAFPSPDTNPDLSSSTVVVPAVVDLATLEELNARDDVRVWPNSELTLLVEWDPALQDVGDEPGDSVAVLDAPGAPAGLDCRPFKPGVEIDVIRQLLDVAAVWDDGHRGEGIVVGIIDEGIDGTTYPVVGGFSEEHLELMASILHPGAI